MKFIKNILNNIFKRYSFNFLAIIAFLLSFSISFEIFLSIVAVLLELTFGNSCFLYMLIESILNFALYLLFPMFLCVFLVTFIFFQLFIIINNVITKNIINDLSRLKLYFKIFGTLTFLLTTIILFLCKTSVENAFFCGLYILLLCIPISFVIFVTLLLLELNPNFRIKYDYIIGNKYYRICAISGTLFLILLFLAG